MLGAIFCINICFCLLTDVLVTLPKPSGLHYNQGSLYEGSGRGLLKFLHMGWLTLSTARTMPAIMLSGPVSCAGWWAEQEAAFPVWACPPYSFFPSEDSVRLSVSLALCLSRRDQERLACVKSKPCALAQFNENLCSRMRSTGFPHINQMGHVLLSRGVYFHQEHLRGENPRYNSGILSPLDKQQLIILLSHSKPYNLLSLLPLLLSCFSRVRLCATP